MNIQEEEDALVARVEARIRYALNQPQHRTRSNPTGVLPEYHADANEWSDVKPRKRSGDYSMHAIHASKSARAMSPLE